MNEGLIGRMERKEGQADNAIYAEGFRLSGWHALLYRVADANSGRGSG